MGEGSRSTVIPVGEGSRASAASMPAAEAAKATASARTAFPPYPRSPFMIQPYLTLRTNGGWRISLAMTTELPESSSIWEILYTV